MSIGLKMKLILKLALAVVIAIPWSIGVIGGPVRNLAEPNGFDLDGHPIPQLAGESTRAVVLIFVATDCPISKRYIPEITRLEQEFGKQGVAFWWVYPNPGDTAAEVRKHELAFSIRSSTIIDSHQDLVRMAHVGVTPEAALFAVDRGALREVYHGRIDDRYIAFGTERPNPTRHDLEDGIRAVLAGRIVQKPTGGPVGCSIVPSQLVR